MIICYPTGLISWNYRVALENGEEASVTFSTFREQAEITVSRQTYRVTKGGFMSGNWDLVLNNQSVASASKPNPFIRRFEVATGPLSFDFGATTILTRSFNFSMDSRRIGTLAPDHIFTRRTAIDCAPVIPVHVQLFCLTLAVFLWRRAARSSNS